LANGRHRAGGLGAAQGGIDLLGVEISVRRSPMPPNQTMTTDRRKCGRHIDEVAEWNPFDGAPSQKGL
jgi:hypothetical protein